MTQVLCPFSSIVCKLCAYYIYMLSHVICMFLCMCSELGLEDVPPPLPERNYSWSDIEDNDEEFCQSDDDLDEPSTMDHQKMYSNVR